MNSLSKIVLVVSCIGTALGGTASAYAASPGNLPGNGGLTWSDCVYDTPAPTGSTMVVNYQYGIKLTCASVIHVRAGHGFNDYTENCIGNALNHLYYKETSKSNAGNWIYSALYSGGGNEYTEYYQVFIVVSKSTGEIQTAYTTTNTIAGNDSWQTCASIRF